MSCDKCHVTESNDQKKSNIQENKRKKDLMRSV